MDFQVGDQVETARAARYLWRRVPIKTPGVVTSVKLKQGMNRYTVAFEASDRPGVAIVIRGIQGAYLQKVQS